MKDLRVKKWHKAAIGISLFIAVLLFAAPRIARWYIVKNSAELIGRNLEIDKIRLNYFTGTFRIKNLRLYELNSDSVFLSFKQLKVNLNYLPFFKNEIFIKYIILDEPYVQVLQDGIIFNFSDLLVADTIETEQDAVPEKVLKYFINNISIKKGYVKYTDQVLKHSISMNRVDLEIPGFTWNSDSTNLGVDFRFTDGGRLYSNLAINLADSTYTVKLKLDSLNLDIIEPYVENTMYISALNGYLSNDILIKGDMRSIMRLSFQGINRIFNFQLQDTLKRTIFSFDDLTLDIDTLQPDRNRISINSIKLTRPYILVERIDSTNNWLALMKPSDVEQSDTLHQEADTVTDEDRSPLAFSQLEITDGKIVLSDITLRYPFDYTIDKIQITSTPDSKLPGNINVMMSAVLNGTGNFTADASMNPKDVNYLDMSVSISQFVMRDVDAYFKHYFGYPVIGGRMNFSTENKLRNEYLVSDNSLYFRKFALDKKTEGKTEYNIPLRLALGVMSDKDGIIDLNAPVEMKGEDVRVGNIRKIIFRAIGNLFIKAATSPYNLLADLFKVDPESLKKIQLGLTDPSPDENSLKTLDVIVEILTEKPELNIDFYYCLDRIKAIDTMAYIMAMADYTKNRKGIVGTVTNVADSILIKYLKEKLPEASAQDSADLKTLCRNYVGTVKLNASLDSLKSLQTRFLKSYLHVDKAVPVERFNIFENKPDTIKLIEINPSFSIYFTAAGE